MIFSALFAFLIPFLVTVTVLPFLIDYSEKTGKVVDVAEGDKLKIHKKPMSLLGGVGMALGALVGFLFILDSDNLFKVIALAGGFFLIFLVMFYDDLKWKHALNIKPLKLFLLALSSVFAVIFLFFAGIMFDFVPFFIFSILLGFIYVFTVINSINYQDGMDGLAAGLTLISFIGFALLGLIFKNDFALLVSLIFAGSVSAFLFFNFPPAKVFMGDSGAYSLGFILAVLAFSFSKPYSVFSILGPFFIIGLPVFDGVFTNIRRLAEGKSIFLGDRDHFYDKLMKTGFSTKKTIFICYYLQIIFILTGILFYLL